MQRIRIPDVARLIGVSDDTVRRWVDQGRLPADRGPGGRLLVDGADVARFVVARRRATDDGPAVSSARNRLEGIVTEVQRDGLVAVVEIQAGPFRVVSMMTREAADDLGLEPGVPATAVVKATNVVVERSPVGEAQ
ncbi:TOBE domain-containing protein [Agromyces indicus]|uniref:Helix-turn-helix transcriptional regulator n=1 Tax=Agromyces indicus TaxID=758919 RepID=A0ABU1FLM6_9MICO|nr:helix-turn-helix transcriptional regulator [Agromyces indicus]MDR5692660.1 helix-turn-helix transcriptional regulator [Agromyces indicus]